MKHIYDWKHRHGKLNLDDNLNDTILNYQKYNDVKSVYDLLNYDNLNNSFCELGERILDYVAKNGSGFTQELAIKKQPLSDKQKWSIAYSFINLKKV